MCKSVARTNMDHKQLGMSGMKHAPSFEPASASNRLKLVCTTPKKHSVYNQDRSILLAMLAYMAFNFQHKTKY